MTDPTRDRRAAACRYARIEGKPVLASWMGGARGRGGRADPARGRHPDVRLPRHRVRAVQPPVALRRQPAVAVRDAGPAGGARARRGRARTSTGSSPRSRAEGRTLLTEYESKKVLAAYGIPITDTRVARHAGRGRRGRRRDRLPGRRSSSCQPDDHPQDRRRRRASQPARRRRGPRGVRRRSATRSPSKAGHRALRGRDGPADDQLDRLRAHRRARRPTRSSGRCSCSGWAASWSRCSATARSRLPPLNTTLARRLIERDRRSPRRSRASAAAGRSTRTRSQRCSCGSASSSRSSRGSPRSTSTRCSRRPSGSSPSTRGSSCTRPTVADADLPRLAIRPYPREYVSALDGDRRRRRARRPADPARGRAARSPGSTPALSEETVRARYGERPVARRADRARAADPDLLRRLRPPVRARRRGAGVDGEAEIAGIARVSRDAGLRRPAC